jgi:hypothetical protein
MEWKIFGTIKIYVTITYTSEKNGMNNWYVYRSIGTKTLMDKVRMVFLGEADGYASLSCPLKNLFVGTVDECIDAFHQDMVKIFRQYDNETVKWSDIKRTDISMTKTRKFIVSTDGTALNVVPSVKDSDQEFDLIEYGTCGGLHLEFNALLLSADTKIPYTFS